METGILCYITPGPSKLEKVVDPDFDRDLGIGPRFMVMDPPSGSTTFTNFDGPGITYIVLNCAVSTIAKNAHYLFPTHSIFTFQ